MAHPQSLRPFALAAMVAVVVATVWALTAPRALMPPVSPLGEQPIYSVADDPALTLLEPVLHAPWLGTVTAPARWVVAFIVMLGASGVAIFAGASLLATAFVALALVLDASFGAALTHAGGLVVAIGLVWLASGAAFDEHQRVSADRPWFNPLSAILLWSLAVWWDWMAIVTWPIVLAALRRTPQRPARGAWTLASLLLGAGAFLAHFEWMASRGAGAVSGARRLAHVARRAGGGVRFPAPHAHRQLCVGRPHHAPGLPGDGPGDSSGCSSAIWRAGGAARSRCRARWSWPWGLAGRNGRPRCSGSRSGRWRRWRRWGSPGSRSRARAGPGRR